MMSPTRSAKIIGLAVLLLGVGVAAWLLMVSPPPEPAAKEPKQITLIPAPKPPPPPVPEGPVVPEPTTNVHRGEASELCLGCHDTAEGPGLRLASLSATCARCHAESHDDKASHPVAVVVPPSMPTTLPLGPGRRIDCHTCHDPHGKGRRLLRGKNAVAMCSDCHKGY